MSKQKIMAAHQPNFFPYLGFFDKMKKCDIFVIRDEVAYSKGDLHDRNKRRINSSSPKFEWMGVLIDKNTTKEFLQDVLIKDGKRGKRHWKKELIHSIKSSYEKAPFFKEYFPQIEEIINNVEFETHLVEFNLEIIKYLAKCFDIKTPIIKASLFELRKPNVKSNPTKDLIDLCKATNSNCYLSGNGAKTYLEEELFNDEISLKYQDFTHPVYEQHLPNFLPYMSSIDALFCVGIFPEQTTI